MYAREWNWKYTEADGVIECGFVKHYCTVAGRFYHDGQPFYYIGDTTLSRGYFAYDARPAAEFENHSTLWLRHHATEVPIILNRMAWYAEKRTPYILFGKTECESITRSIHTGQQQSFQVDALETVMAVGVSAVVLSAIFTPQHRNRQRR